MITFSEKRHTEVSSILQVIPNQIIKTTIFIVPTIENVIEFQAIDQEIKLIPVDTI